MIRVLGIILFIFTLYIYILEFIGISFGHHTIFSILLAILISISNFFLLLGSLGMVGTNQIGSITRKLLLLGIPVLAAFIIGELNIFLLEKYQIELLSF